jgi:hypothetical protein
MILRSKMRFDYGYAGRISRWSRVLVERDSLLALVEMQLGKGTGIEALEE